MTICCLATLFMASLFASRGYDATWRIWNVPTLVLPFGDLRVITGGAESRRQGLDPMMENPGDPWHRPLNYPRVWQSLYRFGLTPDHTTIIGFTFIVLFLVGVCLILPNASWRVLSVTLVVLLSPATLLGMERGNIDLLMFFFISLAVIAAKRSPSFSAAAVFAGFALKLYPLFAGAILLRAGRSTFFRLIVALFVATSTYVILTYSDFALIRAATQNGIVFSYGTMVLPTSLGIEASLATILSYLAVLLALLLGFTALRRKDFPSEARKEATYLDAFRAGAAIYLGTFVLGNNWDYRLIFLILTLPQLFSWAGGSARHAAGWSIAVLSSTILSMWYLKIAWFAGSVAVGGLPACFLLDQMYKWTAFTGLLYLFVWSLPDWVKDALHALFPILRCGTLAFSQGKAPDRISMPRD